MKRSANAVIMMWTSACLAEDDKDGTSQPYSTGAAMRWRTVRVWKQRVVIAERIEGLAPVGDHFAAKGAERPRGC
jgi:hypothetical protein